MPPDGFFDLACEIAVKPYVRPKLYAHRGAGLSVMLTWDRAGREHVATVFDYRTVGRLYTTSDGWVRRAFVVCWDTFDDGVA